MRVLLVNDDGPPRADSSPFILPWFSTLKSLHPTWDISVVIPDSQKSWISKAFHIAEKITATFYDPETGTTSPKQQSSEDWLLLNGTPSTCANIGLHHVAGEKDFDLVISGPNFGRNSATVFTLSSGTIGGAMEAALSGYRAIALSFAIFDKHWTEQMVNDCCLLSSQLLDHLLEIWTPEVHIYNVNIPLFKDVLSTKIFFTRLLENRTGSLFRLLSAEENESHERSINQKAAEAEKKLREEGKAEDDDVEWHDDTDILSEKDYGGIKRWQWSMDFKGLEKFVNEHGQKGGGMTDGWCINQRWASVTALRATYQVVDGGAGGIHGGQEIILKS